MIWLTFVTKHWKAGLRVAAVAAVLAAAAYVQQLRDERARLRVDKNNAEALADTLKVKYSRDSVVVMGLLAFQSDRIKGLRDSLHLAGRTQVATRVTVKPKPVHEEHGRAPADSAAATTLVDSVVGPPVDARAAVTIYAHADTQLFARWSWDLRPRPIPLTVDVGCLEAAKPEVLIRAPSWAQLSDVQTTTKLGVCGKEPAKHGVSWWAVRAGVVLVAGKVGGDLLENALRR